MSGALSRVAEGLALGATPTFAVMGLATAVAGDVPMEAFCGPAAARAHDGMVVMYLLMSAFHLGPWLKRAAWWR